MLTKGSLTHLFKISGVQPDWYVVTLKTITFDSQNLYSHQTNSVTLVFYKKHVHLFCTHLYSLIYIPPFVYTIVHICVFMEDSCGFCQDLWSESRFSSLNKDLNLLPIRLLHLFNYLSSSSILYLLIVCLTLCLKDISLFISLPLICVQCSDSGASWPSPW